MMKVCDDPKPKSLAVAVAEDLNDQLTILLSAVDVVAELVNSDPLAGPMLREMNQAALRCADLADRLLEERAPLRRGVAALE